MIEVYKILYGLYNLKTTSHLFTLNKSSSTRGHEFKLTKYHTKSSLHANFFTNRVVSTWNNLPNSVVTAGTLNSFKNGLDKHWEHLMFSVEINM